MEKKDLSIYQKFVNYLRLFVRMQNLFSNNAE